MSTNSTIEWTDATWNPISGCTKVSPGCANCYIARTPPFRIGHRQFDEKGTTGVLLHPERLSDPFKWKAPKRVFVNSLSDLFHDEIPTEFILKVFETMAFARQHVFQVLTKRPARMLHLLKYGDKMACDSAEHHRLLCTMPLPNVWLGVSVENQHFADERIPMLLQTPAAVRFISVEPLLSEVKLKWEWVSRGKPFGGGPQINMREPWEEHVPEPALDWCIVGGESGPGARPMHPDWARSLRDQCVAAGVKYFFKQWGEHEIVGECAGGIVTAKVGKKKAGRLLDGREWNEFPQ